MNCFINFNEKQKFESENGKVEQNETDGHKKLLETHHHQNHHHNLNHHHHHHNHHHHHQNHQQQQECSEQSYHQAMVECQKCGLFCHENCVYQVQSVKLCANCAGLKNNNDLLDETSGDDTKDTPFDSGHYFNDLCEQSKSQNSFSFLMSKENDFTDANNTSSTNSNTTTTTAATT